MSTLLMDSLRSRADFKSRIGPDSTNQYYFDANATTRPHKEVIELMNKLLETAWANPISNHREGKYASSVLEWARGVVADLLNVTVESVIFTSCATESNVIAIRKAFNGVSDGVMITSSIEHSSVLRTAQSLPNVTLVQIPVDSAGIISIDELIRALDKYKSRAKLVSVMLANNETGVLQPIRDIVQCTRDRAPTCFIHTDATQVLGRMPLDLAKLGVDMVTGAAHKFQGPQGVGILYINPYLLSLRTGGSVMSGGGQEFNLRGGTVNVPSIAGAAQAMLINLSDRAKWERLNREMRSNRDEMQRILSRVPGARINGVRRSGTDSDYAAVHRLPNTLSVSFPNVLGIMLQRRLDKRGISVGVGSACSRGLPSRIIEAMYPHNKRRLNQGTIRISLTPGMSSEMCARVAEVIVEAYRSELARNSEQAK